MAICSPCAANCRWFSPFHFKSSSEKCDIEPRGFRSRRSGHKNLSVLLRTEAAVKAIRRKANSSKYTNLWPKAVLEALDDAIELNHWESALKIFSLLRKQQWYEPKCQTYTMLLLMLEKCKLPVEAGILFDTLLSDGLRPTLDVYTALVTAYSSSGLLEKAMQIVDQMKNPPPDAVTYSAIIKSCFDLHQLGTIPYVLNEMSDSGIEFTEVTFNILIDGYGKAKRFESMEHWLNEMIDGPDIYTFNSVIGAYGRAGMIEEMERKFDEFRAMGLNPDVVTYNTMIKSYGLRGMYCKMANVREFMKKRFISPTVVTYNTMIEAYGRVGNVGKMEEVFLEMKDGGLGFRLIQQSQQALLAAVDSNREPWDYREALQSEDWRRAMGEEIAALEKNETWTVETLPPANVHVEASGSFESSINRMDQLNDIKLGWLLWVTRRWRESTTMKPSPQSEKWL